MVLSAPTADGDEPIRAYVFLRALGLLGGSLCGWLMVSCSEFLMEKLAQGAKVERWALEALRYRASTICVSPRYGVVL